MRRVLFVFSMALLALWGGYHWLSSPTDTRQVVQVLVPRGSGSLHIGELLTGAGVIRSSWVWFIYVWARGWQDELQAGTYRIEAGSSLEQIAEQIRSGRVLLVRYRIPEGWNLEQMARYFEGQRLFKATAFLAEARGPASQRPSWLPVGSDRLEGFLFPSTYALSVEQVTPRAVVSQMLQSFEREALPLYRAVGNPTLSIRDWVTLASIVEKEAVVPVERPRIAGVFLERLKLGMPLGSDPTVEYALHVRQTPDHPLTFAQIRVDSPYNTYRHPGLPPTPIASPGLASLQAVLKPDRTPYLYFMARYDGTHIFSRTLADHEQAKRLVRAGRRAVGKSVPP